MKKLTLLTLYLLVAINLFGQDNYKGIFAADEYFTQTSTKIPIGKHIGYDADEGLKISINYGQGASLEDITVEVNADTLYHEPIRFPSTEIEWIEIKKGLWINSTGEGEVFYDSFDESDEIKMHYAGFLESGKAFDNSFIRNQPLKGKLAWFIPGFAIGSVNVMPNTIRIIKIAPELAYGSKGASSIPPNSTIFYVIYNLENPRA